MTLSDLRKEHNKTQSEIADSIGISQAALSKIEHKGDMRISTLEQYLKQFGGKLMLTVKFKDGTQHLIRLKPYKNED